jgi:diguanylate cyclase (GGDEF)-like protein
LEEHIINVLLVEDNAGDARLVVEMLREIGSRKVNLTHVDTVAAAIAFLTTQADDVDIVLLDLSLPDEHGLDTVRRVLAVQHPASVVVMTGDGDEEVGDAAVGVGAQDYLVKNQVDAATLRKALRFAMRRQDKRAQLEAESLTDALTGLNNRRGFMIHGEQHLKLARRNLEPIVMLFIDLDRFKEINDTYGHAEGDRALQETAAVLKRSLRESDIKARIGGDEFVGLALNASEAGAQALRVRLETALTDINVQRNLPYTLTCSVGLFRCQPEPSVTMEELLKRADELMYEEKKRKKLARV